jgi:hypothetical protein
MTIETGALEQCYIKQETAYNVTPADALAGSDGVRHLELSIESKKNREPSPEKRGTPDVSQMLPRRQSTNWDLSSIMWEPSGTIGTISNVGKLLTGGFGSSHTANLVTTIASGASATGATLTSGTGLAVGDIVVVTMPAGHREITRLKTVAGAVVTWDALSVSPSVSAAVISGLTYLLTNNITHSFAIYKYYNAGNFKQAAYGSVVNRIQARFHGMGEVMLGLNGPSANYADTTFGTVQAKPGTHVTVGAPASGLVGNFYVDGNSFLVISAEATIENNIELRNKELGTAFATGIAGRADLRVVRVQVTFYMEDTRLFTMGNAASTTGVLRCVVGDTNGSIVGMVCPKVEFERPAIGNEIGPKEVTIEGMALATSGNDQVFFGEL